MPEADVEGEDIENLAGGEFRVCFHDIHGVPPTFIGRSNGGMVRQWDLGVRDDGGRKEGVCCTAEAALHPADGEGYLPHGCFYTTAIAPMPNKAATVATGTRKLAGLDGIHEGVIKFL